MTILNDSDIGMVFGGVGSGSEPSPDELRPPGAGGGGTNAMMESLNTDRTIGGGGS